MTLRSTGGSSSIFENGKLKPGIYKIQNIETETFLDIKVPTREVCCRPARDLGEGRGLKWEIKRLGVGYTVQKVDSGGPEQFCTPLKGVHNGTTLRVAPYLSAWEVKVVYNDNHRGFEYVRFYWGTENIVWDLAGACRDNGAPVQTYVGGLDHTWQMWRLIPVKVEGALAPPRSSFGTLESGSLPSYEGDAGESSTLAQRVESEQDEFGTVVNEVTVVTTTSTVTTRKKYRVEDA